MQVTGFPLLLNISHGCTGHIATGCWLWASVVQCYRWVYCNRPKGSSTPSRCTGIGFQHSQ